MLMVPQRYVTDVASRGNKVSKFTAIWQYFELLYFIIEHFLILRSFTAYHRSEVRKKTMYEEGRRLSLIHI